MYGGHDIFLFPFFCEPGNADRKFDQYIEKVGNHISPGFTSLFEYIAFSPRGCFCVFLFSESYDTTLILAKSLHYFEIQLDKQIASTTNDATNKTPAPIVIPMVFSSIL